MSKSGIVNVRMVITEEKILSNIEKVQKMINPKSKKQIVQLEEDTYFKDLIESIKTYLIEYPKKKNFPSSVYKAAYGLVEFATNQFEENTKKIEELIRQREQNISLAGQLKELIDIVDNKEENWKEKVKESEDSFSEDIIDTLNIVGKCKSKKTQNYEDAIKLLNPASKLNKHVQFETKSYFLNEYINNNVDNNLKVVIIGDSFHARYLHLLAENFHTVKSLFVGFGYDFVIDKYTKDFLFGEKPDILIIESAERFLQRFLNMDTFFNIYDKKYGRL